MGLSRIVFTVLSLRPSTGKIRFPQAVRPSRCAARSELAMIKGSAGAIPRCICGGNMAAGHIPARSVRLRQPLPQFLPQPLPQPLPRRMIRRIPALLLT